MDPQSPSEAALEYVNVYNRHDRERLRQLYHEDFLVENPLWQGTRNVEQTVETIAGVWATLPGARFEPYNVAVAGDTVLLEFFFAWDDPRGGEVVTRRMPVADVFTVKDGKLFRLRAYMNSGEFHEWLDAMRAAA
jgi:ketosteroid isomerase-like protein